MGRGVFVAVIGVLVLVGMALLLILNTTLAQGAFDLQQLRAQYDSLQVQEQAMARQVAQAQSPEALRSEAVRLGMVPVQVPVFLRLADGEVLGDPTPAKARVTQQARLARMAATDAASPTVTDAAAVVAPPPQSDGAEASEQAAARDGRRARDRAAGTPPADVGAVVGPEGAEQQAAPPGTGTGTGRG